jgi:hypothetical protein
MTLCKYLKKTGESQSGFAKRSGLHRQQVGRLLGGADLYGQSWARVTLATGGAVMPQDHWPARGIKTLRNAR